MAVLTVYDLSLEIAYRAKRYGWTYEIVLSWRGEPVLNDPILKRRDADGANRPAGAVIPCGDGECGILPLLQKVLETNEPDYRQPLDPDFLLAIYPDGGFPFLPPKWTLVWASPERKAELEAEEAMRAKCGPLPEDPLELMLLVDVYNFAGANMYYGDGLCFRLRPTRACLQQFYNDLPSEYARLGVSRRIDKPESP